MPHLILTIHSKPINLPNILLLNFPSNVYNNDQLTIHHVATNHSPPIIYIFLFRHKTANKNKHENNNLKNNGSDACKVRQTSNIVKVTFYPLHIKILLFTIIHFYFWRFQICTLN